jgi:uncharacterized damage-inducible protein DinB
MATINELMQELEHEARTTRRVLERVPSDQLGWKPHDKSLSLGQLAYHVATIPGVLSELAMQDGFDVSAPIPRPTAAGTAELLTRLDESMAKARAILGGLDDAGLGATWTMRIGGRAVGSMTRGAMLRALLLNHWYHHRGQLTVYLRETGALVPSVYGASADELPPAA